MEVQLISSRFGGQHVCDLRRAVLWIETKCGITENPRMMVGVAAPRGWAPRNLNSFGISGEDRQKLLDFCRWQVGFPPFVSPLVCREFFLRQVELVLHTAGFTTKMTIIEHSQQDWSTASNAVFIRPNCHVVGHATASETEVCIPPAAISWLTSSSTKSLSADRQTRKLFCTPDQLQPFLFSFLRLNLQLSGCHP